MDNASDKTEAAGKTDGAVQSVTQRAAAAAGHFAGHLIEQAGAKIEQAGEAVGEAALNVGVKVEEAGQKLKAAGKKLGTP